MEYPRRKQPNKKKKILHFLKKEKKTDIALVQETHLSKLEHLKLQKDWGGQVYSPSFSSKRRGVAILIRKCLPLQVDTVQPDFNGCYVLIKGNLYGESIMLLNVYAPPKSPPCFFAVLAELVSEFSIPNVIIGGDWNCILDPNLDKSSQTKFINKSSKCLNQLINDMCWVDIWCLKN